MHTKRLNPMLPQNQLLPTIHIPQPNINQFLQADHIILLQPPKDIFPLLLRKSSKKGDRHPVHIPTLARLGSVDITMCIDPDNRHLTVQALPYRLRGPCDRANGYTVVASKSEHAAPFFGVRIDLFRKLLGHGGDGERVLHAAIIWVGGGEELFVGVYSVVVEELVAEFFAELGEQAARDER